MSTFKFNQGTMSNEELDKLTKFWNKKQFRTWSKKELERSSKDMQNLLVALKEFSADEIKAIRKLNRYAFGTCRYAFGTCRYAFGTCYKNDPKFIVWVADQRDLDYAISIAPKTFKVKQG